MAIMAATARQPARNQPAYIGPFLPSLLQNACTTRGRRKGHMAEGTHKVPPVQVRAVRGNKPSVRRRRCAEGAAEANQRRPARHQQYTVTQKAGRTINNSTAGRGTCSETASCCNCRIGRRVQGAEELSTPPFPPTTGGMLRVYGAARRRVRMREK